MTAGKPRSSPKAKPPKPLPCPPATSFSRSPSGRAQGRNRLRRRIGLLLQLDDREEESPPTSPCCRHRRQFPKFVDGRGYSTAALLRQRYLPGELRAVGDILHDQLFFDARVGFDASFARKDDKSAAYAIAAGFFHPAFGDAYQGATTQFRQTFSAARAEIRHVAMSLLNITPELTASVVAKTAAVNALLADIAGELVAGRLRQQLRRRGHGADRPDRQDQAADRDLQPDTGRLPPETYDLMVYSRKHTA